MAESSSDGWPGVKKCQGDASVRCDADAVYLADDGTGLQWFVCQRAEHWVNVRLLVPLSHWHARLGAVFSAEEAYERLTGREMPEAEKPDWRTIEVPGLPSLESAIVQVDQRQPPA